MPDWTYQTVFRPILLGLGPRNGKKIALGGMGRLARLPLGKRVIQLMGHMHPDSRLAIERCGFRFPTAVGLSCVLDPELRATPAFGQFGFGFLEIGPIALSPAAEAGPIHVDVENENVRFERPRAALTPNAACARLKRDSPLRLPIFARIDLSSSADARRIVEELAACVDAFVARIDQLDAVREVLSADGEKSSLPRPSFAAIDAAAWRDEARREHCVRAIRDGWLSGIVVGAATEQEAQQIGKAGFAEALETVRQVRANLGPQPIVIASVGIHSPADGLDYFEAGADLVQVDSGLVFTGPGLPKRINEALLYRRLAAEADSEPLRTRAGSQSWLWALLMGLSMVIGGVIAMVVATTRVVLPYDESMAGLSREQLAEINPRLLSFMTHDRVTLAGTMLAVGILYLAMAWWGIRRGVHWAYISVIVSALAGFFSFFSFLGFGYFDPFHAFVTAVLFQFLLLTIHAYLPERQQMEPPDLHNDGSWKANQWGQLLFTIHGAILVVAGIVISWIGMTSVFVPEDLQFMQTSAEELFGSHPQLVPLVAHDRATFGGMLIACGVATLLPAMWGFRRGQAWLWWALMLAGNLAYLSTVLVHWVVGYHSLKHLLPAYGGLILLWIGGISSYPFLVARDRSLESEWGRRLGNS